MLGFLGWYNHRAIAFSARSDKGFKDRMFKNSNMKISHFFITDLQCQFLMTRSMHLLSVLLKEIKREKKAGCEVQNARDKWFSFEEQCDKHKVCRKMTLPDFARSQRLPREA